MYFIIEWSFHAYDYKGIVQLLQISFGTIGLSLGVSLLSWVLFFRLHLLHWYTTMVFHLLMFLFLFYFFQICSYGFSSSYVFVFILFQIYSYGFGAYFNILPGSEWSAIMLTYGFPLAIIGMALKVNNFLLRESNYKMEFMIATYEILIQTLNRTLYNALTLTLVIVWGNWSEWMQTHVSDGRTLTLVVHSNTPSIWSVGAT